MTSLSRDSHSLLLLLLASLFTPLLAQNETDCQAGTYFDTFDMKCRYCDSESPQWSEDASLECKACPTSPTKPKHCICDTRPPRAYGDSNLSAAKKCNINGRLNCSRDCYYQAGKALMGRGGVKLTELLNIMPCNCNNPTTKENCTEAKHFTNNCFLNECDGERFYLPAADSQLLNSCYDEYKANKTCTNKSCTDKTLFPYLKNLLTCNCYHYNDSVAHDKYAQYAECDERRKFYAKFESVCKLPSDTVQLALTIVLPLLCIGIIVVLVLARYLAVDYLRKLKKSGRIEKIRRHIVWSKVEALVFAGHIRNNMEIPANKEIVVKIRFALIGGWFGEKLVKPQHVVLKIFSESRSEAQATELEIINNFHDKSKAKAHNIISIYGPPEKSSNEQLVKFLEKLVDRSNSIEALKKTIKQCYLDPNNNEPRCHYIMMNHCNALSLTEFMSNGSLSPCKIRQLCKDLAKALNFLHEGNTATSNDGEVKHTVIVHCDIKPDNIFVKERGKKTAFILGDFGFAGIHHKGLGITFKPKGYTWAYAPPEWLLYKPPPQTRGQTIPQPDPKSDNPTKLDIYQYGLVVWLALHNKANSSSTRRAAHPPHPWDDEWREAINARRQANDEEPVRLKLEEFLKNMFSEKPGRRPQFKLDPNYTHPQLKGLQSLVEQCWQENINARPSAADIRSKLDQSTVEPTNVISLNYLVTEDSFRPVTPVVEV